MVYVRFLVLVLAVATAACQSSRGNDQSMSSPAAGPQVGMMPPAQGDEVKTGYNTW